MALVVKNPPADEGDKRDVGLVPGSGRSPRGGNGNPLQYSCLGNPMDRGAWQERLCVHRVAKSGIRLRNWACILQRHSSNKSYRCVHSLTDDRYIVRDRHIYMNAYNWPLFFQIWVNIWWQCSHLSYICSSLFLNFLPALTTNHITTYPGWRKLSVEEFVSVLTRA